MLFEYFGTSVTLKQTISDEVKEKAPLIDDSVYQESIMSKSYRTLASETTIPVASRINTGLDHKRHFTPSKKKITMGNQSQTDGATVVFTKSRGSLIPK